MKKGISAIRDIQGSGSKEETSGIWKLWLRERERASFWFVTDGEDIALPRLHQVVKSGKNNKSWTKDVLCAKSHQYDDTPCAVCDIVSKDPVTDKWIVGPAFQRMILLTFVTDIYHAEQNVKADNPWKPMPTADGMLYREEVNGYRLLIAKQRLEAQIEQAYNGDPTAEDFDPNGVKTLLDRPYQLVRTGKGQTTTETLLARDAKEVPEIVSEAMAKRPDLEAIIISDFADSTQGARAKAVVGGYDPEGDSESNTNGGDPSDDEVLIAFD